VKSSRSLWKTLRDCRRTFLLQGRITPREIANILNRAARGKTHIKVKLLNEEETYAFIRNINWGFLPKLRELYDIEYMHEVASRVYKLIAGTGNLDFSMRNDTELAKSWGSKWKCKMIEQYAAEVNGMPGDWH
jgi:hypothetical protein